MPFPDGTVTFLFTDIQGSTRLWEQHPEAMRLALARHDTLLRTAIEQCEGHIFKTIGDAFCAAFHTASQALAAALTAQQALQGESWLEPVTLTVRMALHTGAAELRDRDYFGQPLNRVARLLSVGHGGQVLLSLPTEELVRDTLPVSAHLQNLGEHRLRDLDRPETVFQLLHPDLCKEFPPLKSLDNRDLPNNLPHQVTSFIGREREMSEIRNLLAHTSLLTLTGSGGAGKTRLSLQVAAEMLEDYSDGVWLVELASISDPALVPQSVAAVLEVAEQSGKTFTNLLTEHLKTKRTLLLLDNCEHILSACAQLTHALLRACPQVKILASSREGLGIAGEQTYRMPSLSLPDPKQTLTLENISQYEAVRLFVERASLINAEFTVTNQNAPALASVCHRLDGIPLAIELAAARVRSLSVEEINDKLSNRFRLLTGGSKTALPRQQTLRALIDWSYDLLNEQERTLLVCLSVFMGGWTLAAAEAVGTGESASGERIEDWEVLDLLSSLVDKSLVIAHVEEGHTRYRLLETVRQYALDRLLQTGEGETVRGRHRSYFLTWAEEVLPKIYGPEQAHWLNALETEHDNLRLALNFCLEEADWDPQDQAGLRLGGALWPFWDIRGYLSEGREQLNALLAHPAGQAPTLARADVFRGAGILAYDQGNYTLARAHHENSLAIKREIGPLQGVAGALGNLGNVAYAQGDYASARTLLQECLGIFRELGDRRGLAVALQSLGNVSTAQGDPVAAMPLYEESLTIRRELGDRGGIASALSNLAWATYARGDYSAARSLSEEGLQIHRELGDKGGIANALCNLGGIALIQGDEEAAHELLEEGLKLERELENRSGIAKALFNLGSLASLQGNDTAALALHTEELVLRREIGKKEDIAGSLDRLGRLASGEGDYVVARSLLQESLEIRRELEDKKGVAFSLSGFALLAHRQRQTTQAGRLWGAVESLLAASNLSVRPQEQVSYDQMAAVAQERMGEEMFTTAWTEGQALTLEQAIALALQEPSA